MILDARRLSRALGAPLASVTRSSEPADAIVVLGAPILATGELSALAEERVRVGVALWERGLAPVICVVGGHAPEGAGGDPRLAGIEREGMARWVRAMGVPESALRVDRASTSTATNARRAAELLHPEGRRRVWLVTQPFHTRRARFLFERAGFAPLAWAIDDGVQEREPALAIRWIAREYGAWALALLRPRA